MARPHSIRDSPRLKYVGALGSATTPLSEPALAKSPALVLCVGTPYPGFLVGLQGVVQALLLD